MGLSISKEDAISCCWELSGILATIKLSNAISSLPIPLTSGPSVKRIFAIALSATTPKKIGSDSVGLVGKISTDVLSPSANSISRTAGPGVTGLKLSISNPTAL